MCNTEQPSAHGHVGAGVPGAGTAQPQQLCGDPRCDSSSVTSQQFTTVRPPWGGTAWLLLLSHHNTELLRGQMDTGHSRETVGHPKLRVTHI